MRARFGLLLPLALLACSTSGSGGDTAAQGADITDVSPTAAKEQAVGNCWLYAMASWAEALHQSATGQAVDLSESYWTYWHWYNQLTTAGPLLAVETGGSWALGVAIIQDHGWMTEGDFLPDEAGVTRSARQYAAQRTINQALVPGGALYPATKRTEANVTALLATAFGLGPNAMKNVHDAKELALTGSDGSRDSLATLIAGPHAWTVQSTSPDEAWDHALVQAVQRTLHSHRPVYLGWTMDDSHMDSAGAERVALAPGETADHPFRHASVITDYQVTNVPGFGVLPAGVDETRPAALAAALDDSAIVQFFRIKNPWWGTYSATGALNPFASQKTGYNDLYLDYLDGQALGLKRWRFVVLPPEFVPPQL